jgi:hypothetical protein
MTTFLFSGNDEQLATNLKWIITSSEHTSSMRIKYGRRTFIQVPLGNSPLFGDTSSPLKNSLGLLCNSLIKFSRE